jgi:diphosphomevalonate decarboxylase
MITLKPITVTAPSNIAFIKYWGKKDSSLQWPANDSFSMTLSESKTITTATPTQVAYDSFSFEGKTITSLQNPDHKIFRHLSFLRSVTGNNARLNIESKNTFPTGCGIASSASGYAALTIAAVSTLTGAHSFNDLNELTFGRGKLADLARMGSGSASRSLFGGYVQWNAGDAPSNQSITQVFKQEDWQLCDIIVVLSSDEKPVSSSDAHLAAWASPLFTTRIAGIHERLTSVHKAIKSHDLELLGSIIETDALEMHAVAMTGDPRVCYFLNETQKLLTWIRHERTRGQLPAWFTVDAGPNVHLICRGQDSDSIVARIQREWPKASIIRDRTGAGPTFENNHLGGTIV